MKNKKNKMKRKGGDQSAATISKKFVPNPHIGQMSSATGVAYSQMVQSPYSMSGEMTTNNTIHQTYYTNYTNLQYIVDPNQYAAYYQAVPPHIASGMYSQPPPPPLPPEDVSMVKPPLPPGMPPGMSTSGMTTNGMSPPQNRWIRKHNQCQPNNKYRFQTNHPPPPLPPHLSAIKPSPTSLAVMCQSDKPLDEITVSKRAKRKPMSTRYTRKKEWDRDDALKALALENEYNRLQKLPMLILKFPDPELNKEIVKSFSHQIDNVHFQQPSTARYCYVTLRPDANVKEVQNEIGNITFGTGKIMVKKHSHDERTEVGPEEIDPYTLYIGNLPTNVTVAAVKEKFPTAQRIDIGFAQKMKYTRYAFIRYQTIEESIDAFRKTFNLQMDSRSLIVRFRRQKGNVGLPGETRFPKPKALLPAMPESPAILNDFYGTSIDEPILDSPQTPVEIKKPTDNPKMEAITNDDENNVETIVNTTIENIPPEKELEITIPEPVGTSLEPSNLIQPLPDTQLESVDSKANVIAEAMKLMSQKNPINIDITEASISPCSIQDSVASGTSSITLKIKEEAELNKEIVDNFIIGTRVKEEPDDYEDDNEFDEDDSDDEMLDDDDDDDEELIDDKEEDDDDAALYDRFNHFHDMEFNDIDEKEEKPNIEELELLRSTTTSVSGDSIHITTQTRSDYDDLFDSLNPNDNLEL